MTAITDGLPLAYLDTLTVALADLMHQEPEIRDRFGGRTLAGTVDCTPGTTTFAGTGTEWLDGADDSLAPGDRLVAGAQLVKVASVTSDTLLEIEPPPPPATEPGHVAGLDGATIHKAATWGRTKFPHLPIPLAPPYWTVAPIAQAPHKVGPGRRISSPTLQWIGVYEEGADANLLADGQASWAAISALAERAVFADEKSQTLQVSRFDTSVIVQGLPADKSTRLVRQILDHELLPFDVGLPDSNRFMTAASAIFSFEGNDPRTLIPQRW